MSELLNVINQDIAIDSFYSQNFPHDGQRFLAWYLRNVYLRTPVQAKDDVTDGANDRNIDAIIVDDDCRKIIIAPEKYMLRWSAD